LTGCNQQANPAGAGGTPTVLTQKEIDERHAANFLSAAKDYQSEGQQEHAVSALKELIKKFPDSDAATEATQLLTELEPLADELEAESETQE
jgi:outer membrane protein assembly factor BamD (BamD/ComL family)